MCTYVSLAPYREQSGFQKMNCDICRMRAPPLHFNEQYVKK